METTTEAQTETQASPKVSVEYEVAPEWRAKALKERGELVPSTATVAGTLADLSPDLRAALVDALGIREGYIYTGRRWLLSVDHGKPLVMPTGDEPLGAAVAAALDAHLVAAQKVAERKAAEEAARERDAALRAQAIATMTRETAVIERMAAEGASDGRILDALFPDADLRAAADSIQAWDSPVRQAVSAAQQKRDRDKAEAFRAEMEAWAAAHGSAHLKRALERGYKATRTYAGERAALEAPGWIVDVADRAEWRERVDPSPAALDAEAQGIGLAKGLASMGSLPGAVPAVRVVWLTKHPAASQEWGEPQQEAIVISGYLGRYDLILPLGADGDETDEADD